MDKLQPPIREVPSIKDDCLARTSIKIHSTKFPLGSKRRIHISAVSHQTHRCQIPNQSNKRRIQEKRNVDHAAPEETPKKRK